MPSENLHTLSLQQLDRLWKYEFHLCAALTGLPLRTCSAIPSGFVTDLYPQMKEEYRLLKQDIRRMWIRASYYLKFREIPGKGLGVFCPLKDDRYPTERLLGPSSFTVLGWRAKAPKEGQCPTAHRYRRSALDGGYYLGGPVSIVNQESVARISVHMPTGSITDARHLATVFSQRKLIPGKELFWTYDADLTSKNDQNYAPISDWFLPECCSEVLLTVTSLPVAEVEQPGNASTCTSEPPVKKRTVGGVRPLTKSRELPWFCLCTYCGANIDEGSNYSPNMKRHMSLYHAVDIVKDLDHDPLDQEDPISSKEFIMHIDMVDNVLDELHKRFFSCQSAYSFLRNFGKEVQLRDGFEVDDEKERVFQLYLKERSKAYKRYQVLYFRGIIVPTKYDDLLPCKTFTSPDKIIWADKRPSNTNFSINQLELTTEEKEDHKVQVKWTLKDIIWFCSH